MPSRETDEHLDHVLFGAPIEEVKRRVAAHQQQLAIDTQRNVPLKEGFVFPGDEASAKKYQALEAESVSAPENPIEKMRRLVSEGVTDDNANWTAPSMLTRAQILRKEGDKLFIDADVPLIVGQTVSFIDTYYQEGLKGVMDIDISLASMTNGDVASSMMRCVSKMRQVIQQNPDRKSLPMSNLGHLLHFTQMEIGAALAQEEET